MTITSLDGKQTISLEEFDRLFDEGSDAIDAFIDWKHPVASQCGISLSELVETLVQ